MLLRPLGLRWPWTSRDPTAPTEAPAAPATLTATPGDAEVALAWAAVLLASSYNLYWDTSPGVTAATGNAIVGVTSPYTHTGRTNGTPYYYVVTAVNGAGEGPESNEASATPAAAVVAASDWIT